MAGHSVVRAHAQLVSYVLNSPDFADSVFGRAPAVAVINGPRERYNTPVDAHNDLRGIHVRIVGETPANIFSNTLI